MSGFFSSTTLAQKPSSALIPRCGACGLFKTCKSPKMPISGKGKKGILIVAEAPGAKEDDDGIQLVGPAGQFLRRGLDDVGIDLDEDCWKTNSIICRPPDSRTPTPDEIDHCRPNIANAIKDLNPRIIVPLGAAAVRSVIAPLWKEDVGTLTQWAGWQIPSQRHNAWITPTYHPSHILRQESEGEPQIAKVWFERHIKAISELVGRPWVKVPDYKKEISLVIDPYGVTMWVDKVLAAGGAIAFDYETNRLKPDPDDSEIVSCAVCWKGVETIAYPWVGEAIEATSRLLRSDLPKIGFNAKFEDRWSVKHLGHDVRNWVWDGMLSAHHLDNREGITSAKFQGLTRVGVEEWGSLIKPYLQSTNSSGVNRIREVDLRSLLVYNGMDALIEYHIAMHQKKEMLERSGRIPAKEVKCLACGGSGLNSKGNECFPCHGSGRGKS